MSSGRTAACWPRSSAATRCMSLSGQPARIPDDRGRRGRQAEARRSRSASGFPTARPTTRKGRIDFVDVSVDRATDTVLGARHASQSGRQARRRQLVRVAVQGEKTEEKVVVPQAGADRRSAGRLCFAVEDGKAVVKRVKIGRRARRLVVVEGPDGQREIIVQGCRPEAGRAGPASPVPAACSAGAEPMIASVFVDRPRLAIVIAHRHDHRRRPVAVAHSRRADPGHRAAAGLGDGRLSRRLGRGGRVDGSAADRGQSHRRRQDALHEERQRQ